MGSDHPYTLNAVLSFYLSQNIDRVSTFFDECDKMNFTRELAMLLLPCTKERAEAYLASSSSFQLFSSLSAAEHKGADKFDWTQVCSQCQVISHFDPAWFLALFLLSRNRLSFAYL